MDTAQWIQIVFGGALFLATVGLVIVTLIYAISTKKMAKVMQREFELKISPIIEPKIYVRKNSLKPMVEVKVKNLGSYPVYFDYIIYKWWHRNKKDVFGYYGFDNQNVNKWIQKGDSHKENIRLYFSRLEGFSKPDDVRKNGMASLELIFIDINRNKFPIEYKSIMF